MWTDLVVVVPPLFDQHLRLGARAKPFEAQTLVAELAVEALRDAILPRLAGLVDGPKIRGQVTSGSVD